MKKIAVLISMLLFTVTCFSQTYFTSMMNYQMYINGYPSGSEKITARKDTISITPKAISLTNFVYGSGKTSIFKVTSVSNNVYTCQIDDFECYKVYVNGPYVIVERYAGKDLFVVRKYLIKPSSV